MIFEQCFDADGNVAFVTFDCNIPGCDTTPSDTCVNDINNGPGKFESFSGIEIQMFDLTVFGVPVAITGILYIVIFSPFLLPGNETPCAFSRVVNHIYALRESYGPPVLERQWQHIKWIDFLERPICGSSMHIFTFLVSLSLQSHVHITGHATYARRQAKKLGRAYGTQDEPEGPPADGNDFADFVVGAKVLKGSPVVNKTVKDAGLRELDELFLVSVVRGGKPVSVCLHYNFSFHVFSSAVHQ